MVVLGGPTRGWCTRGHRLRLTTPRPGRSLIQTRTVPLELVTLAAGLGSRFGGAKQIEGFGPGGETILELNAFDGLRWGVEGVTWVTRSELVTELRTLAARIPCPVRIAVQPNTLDPSDPGSPVRERPWGTGHAWIAAGSSSAPSLVLNADDLYGADAVGALCAVVGSAPDTVRPTAWVAGYRVGETLSPHGGVSRAQIDHSPVGGQYRVDRLVELTQVRRSSSGGIRGADPEGGIVALPDDALVSMNLWAFSGGWDTAQQASLRRFADSLSDTADAELRIPDIVFEAVEADRADAFVVPVESRWAGVTFPEDRAHLESVLLEEFASGAYPSPLFS